MGYDRILKISFLFLFLFSIPTVQGAIIFDGDVNSFTRPGGGLLTFDDDFLVDRVIFENNSANFYNLTYDSFWELVGFNVPANVTVLVETINNNTILFDVIPTFPVVIKVNVGTKGNPLAVLGADSWVYDAGNTTVNMNISIPGDISIHWNVIPTGFCDYVVTSFENVTGVVVDGVYQDTWVLDDHVIILSEELGVPGFDYVFNISDIAPACLLEELIIVERYTGSMGHIVTINILNYTSGLYQNFDTIVDSLVLNTHEINITGMNGDIIQNGTMSIQFYHDSPGNKFHLLEIDYIFLSNIPTIVIPSLVFGDINWLLAFFWIMIVLVGYLKNNKILIMFAGFFGLILGLFMMIHSMMVSIALILLNLYLLYEGTG